MYTRCHFSAQDVKNRKIGVISTGRFAENQPEDWQKKGEPHLSRESHGTDGAPHTVWTQITIFIFESQLLRAIALPQLTTTFAIRATALLAHAV